MIRIILLLTLLTTKIFANTIEFSAFSPQIKCALVKNQLTPHTEPFDDTETKGTLIGYNFKTIIPIARTLIIDDSQTQGYIISKKPKLTQTDKGCLFNFVATSPKGLDFFKPSMNQLRGRRSKITSAQLLIKE